MSFICPWASLISDKGMVLCSQLFLGSLGGGGRRSYNLLTDTAGCWCGCLEVPAICVSVGLPGTLFNLLIGLCDSVTDPGYYMFRKCQLIWKWYSCFLWKYYQKTITVFHSWILADFGIWIRAAMLGGGGDYSGKWYLGKLCQFLFSLWRLVFILFGQLWSIKTCSGKVSS